MPRCCSHFSLGCPEETPKPFDCLAGLSNWQAGWSSEKKSWLCPQMPAEANWLHWILASALRCCTHEGKGCESVGRGWEHLPWQHMALIILPGRVIIPIITKPTASTWLGCPQGPAWAWNSESSRFLNRSDLLASRFSRGLTGRSHARRTGLSNLSARSSQRTGICKALRMAPALSPATPCSARSPKPARTQKTGKCTVRMYLEQ